MKSAQDALTWMEKMRSSASGTWLFRGQTKVHKTVQPSLARLDAHSRVVMYNVCRRFHVAAAGVTGYQIDGAENQLAMLQHYVGLSPIIDLTGTPLIALYFALNGSVPGDECVVYALDANLLAEADSPCHVVNHSFLALPFADGGLQHRWLRQDGYSACPKDWPSMEAVVNFDLLQLRGIREMRFERCSGDLQLVAELGDLESVDNDPLASRVRGAVESILRGRPSCPELEAKLARSKTISPAGLLREELGRIEECALQRRASDSVIRSISSLKDAERLGYWDTAFDHALDSIKKELQC